MEEGLGSETASGKRDGHLWGTRTSRHRPQTRESCRISGSNTRQRSVPDLPYPSPTTPSSSSPAAPGQRPSMLVRSPSRKCAGGPHQASSHTGSPPRPPNCHLQPSAPVAAPSRPRGLSILPLRTGQPRRPRTAHRSARAARQRTQTRPVAPPRASSGQLARAHGHRASD